MNESELRKIFEKKGGTLGSPGSVAWMFQTKGILHVPCDTIEEDDLMEVVLDAGAEDLSIADDVYQIHTAPDTFNDVKQALADRDIAATYAEVSRHPTQTVEITELKAAQKVISFITALEDHDDVQNISANFDMPASLIEQLQE